MQSIVRLTILIFLCFYSSDFFSQSDSEEDLVFKFLGNCNVYISDGETSIMTDGFFSRPSSFKVLVGKLNTDSDKIRYYLDKGGIDTLGAVIPTHSHYDHALDAKEVARITGATVIGSSSSLMIDVRDDDHNLEQIEIKDGSKLTLGAFDIEFIVHPHWEYPRKFLRKKLLDNYIEKPLELPAHNFKFKEGDSFTLIIKHKQTTIAIHGSAGYRTEALKGYDADILFLGVAGLSAMDSEFQKTFKKEVVDALNPEVIVPIHFDNIAKDLKDSPPHYGWLQSKVLKVHSEEDVNYAKMEYNQRIVKKMDLWKPYYFKNGRFEFQ